MFIDKRNKLFKIMVISITTVVFCISTVAMAAQQPKSLMKIRQMIITAGSIGGGWYPAASAMADRINKYFEGYPITAVPGPGGVGNVSRVGTGEADFGCSYPPFLKAGLVGDAPYEQKYPNLRGVGAFFMMPVHIIVGKNVPIDNFMDIKKKQYPLKVASGKGLGSTDYFSLWALCREAGFDIKNIEEWGGKNFGVGSSTAVNLFRDRHVDAWCVIIFPRAATPTEAFKTRPAKIVAITDKEVREKMKEKWGYVDYTFPKGMYGLEEPVPSLGLKFAMFTTEEIPAEAVYYFVKGIVENKDFLSSVNPSFKGWEPEETPQGVGIPLHRGAKMYYEERGWVVE